MRAIIWIGVGAILSAVLLATWSIRLNDAWVRAAAFDYAGALLASCDRILAKAKSGGNVSGA